MQRARGFALAWLICGCHAGVHPAVAPSPVEIVPPPDARVVIFVIDGPRWTEIFGDSSHAHVPGMWNTLRPQGTLCTNFRNEGWTLTIPGHATMLTGQWQHLNNQGLERPAQPTLFEYYRKAKHAPARDAVLLSMKTKLDAVATGSIRCMASHTERRSKSAIRTTSRPTRTWCSTSMRTRRTSCWRRSRRWTSPDTPTTGPAISATSRSLIRCGAHVESSTDQSRVCR